MIDLNDPWWRYEIADRAERPSGWAGTLPAQTPWWRRVLAVVGA